MVQTKDYSTYKKQAAGYEAFTCRGQEKRAEQQTYSECLQVKYSERRECQHFMEAPLCSKLRKQLSAHKYTCNRC